MRRGTRAGVVLVMLLFAGVARDARAQSLGIVSGRDVPEWLVRWSPLHDPTSLPRRLPSATTAMPSLLYPAEKVGLFWTAGNPAALPWDVVDRRNEISSAGAAQEGEYRRPFDPAAARVRRLSGTGWQPLGARGAVVGGVLFDRMTLDPSSVSDVNEPYGSNPLLVTDTTSSALRQTRARLEGAGGWRFGPWGVGLALGYDTRTTRTVAAPFVRRNRVVRPGATGGVMRVIGPLQVGLRLGWQGGEETVSLFEVAQEGVVFQLEGYREVPMQELRPPFVRRFSREVLSSGASVGGRIGRGSWVVYVDGSTLEEEQANRREDDPPADRWSASGSAFGGAAQLGFARERGRLTVHARRAAVSGRAELVPAKTGLGADETETLASAELRVKSGSGAWTGLLRGSIVTENRERRDSVAAAETSIRATTPGIALEVGRRLPRRLDVMAGYALARYSGTGTIPSPASRGPLYQRLFAPELDIATSNIVTRAVSAAVRWQVDGTTAWWIAGWHERLRSQSAARPFAPGGDRTAKGVSLGVTMTPDH